MSDIYYIPAKISWNHTRQPIYMYDGSVSPARNKQEQVTGMNESINQSINDHCRCA